MSSMLNVNVIIIFKNVGQSGKNRTSTTRFQTSATTTIIRSENWLPSVGSNHGPSD